MSTTPLTAEEFLDRLEFLGLLEDKVIANLRRQVAESKKPVSPQTLAKLLVDNGQLTAFQAKKLVGEDTSTPAKQTSTSTPKPAADAKPATKAQPRKPEAGPKTESPPKPEAVKPTAAAPVAGPEQPLAPPPIALEEVPLLPVSSSTKSPAPKDSDLGLATMDDELGLAPSPDAPLLSAPPPPAQAAPPAAKKEEPAEIVELIEVVEPSAPAKRPAPAQPVPRSTAHPPPPAAPLPPPGQGLSRSDHLEALTPLSDSSLMPLGSSGLTPLGQSGLTPLGPSGLTPLSGSKPLPTNLTPSQPVDLFNDPLTDVGPAPSGAVEVGPYGYGSPSTPAVPATPAEPIKKVRARQWDSPWLFIISGALLFSVLALVFLFWVLNRGSADEIFQQAEDDFKAHSYSAALAGYDKFLKNFPTDGKASLAKVRRGMCRILPLTESKDWKRALEESQSVLPEIEAEKDFNEARTDLAVALPDIAAGFASQAKGKAKAKGDQAETAAAQALLKLSKEALDLVNNSAYIPTSVRVTVDTRIKKIQEDVDDARHGIDSYNDLRAALAEIDAAVKGQKTAEAYAVRKRLIKSYPELERDADLHRAVLLISEGEREQVKAADSSLEVIAQDHPAPDERRVVLASTSGAGIKAVEGRVVLRLARGAVYALDASTGRLLWRRFVGFETKAHPQFLSNQPGSDALLVDGRRNELLRLQPLTGQVVWRLPVGEPFAGPALAHDRIFLTTRKGQVIQVDPQSGRAMRKADFPQPLSVEPAVDTRGRVVYQVGEHSNVYVLKVDTLACESVFYVGQKAGSVVVPPLMAQGLLFIAQNTGPDSQLHVLTTDTTDAPMKEAQEPLRLKGRVLLPLAIFSRRVLVVTDLGEIVFFDVDQANTSKPVSVGLRFGPTTKERILGYPLADEGLLWIADRRLAKYEIQTSLNQLSRKSINSEGDTFVGPLERLGDAVINVRQRQSSTAISITASQIDSDLPLWQTDLATPLAGPVQVDAGQKKVLAVTVFADFFNLDAAALQSGLSGKPAMVVGANSPGVTYTRMVELGGGKLVLASANENENGRGISYDPVIDMPTRLLKLGIPPGATSAEPVLFRGGILQPSSQGRVYLLNAASGGDLTLPFQPRLGAGETVGFTRPAVIGAAKDEFVVADNRKHLYRVGIKDQPQPHLAELAQIETTADVVSPVAAAGDTLYAVLRSGTSDVLASYQLPTLVAGKESPLGGKFTWGPQTIATAASGGTPGADLVFLAAESAGLLCLEAGQKQRWATPLPYGPLAGAPLADGADFILASQHGMVWRVAGDTGRELAQFSIGEPLGAGPVRYGAELVLAGSDGVLHFIRPPAASAEAKAP